ncbi:MULTISPECIES: 4Fe-4S dicluster domain-containing protein [unclassified Adlercreutzia]|uniref:4Fe-4S dicluster domain-containing protein n=1 Tax=unclassified Adlercreutzia TaxID=2636013 RepID=UPI0013EE3875|nr:MULTISPECIES: 4Fe-4S dicluster domain-containing protein [unclassified Adlercreutzia]
MTQYGFYYDATRCTGCHTCEAACRDYHGLSLKMAFRRVYEVEGGLWSQASDGTWITDSYAYYTSISCQHCDNPACTQVCPTGAMHKGENGIVSVEEKRCIGCGYCALACPYKAPRVDREVGHSVKCDGCASRMAAGELPICVEACSMRCIEFGSIDELPRGTRAAVAPLPDPSVTQPNLYINECAAAQPFGSLDCRIANAAEVD